MTNRQIQSVLSLVLVFIEAFATTTSSLAAVPPGVPPGPPRGPHPSLVGWGNLLVPGLGETLLGNFPGGAAQFAYELGSFGAGYALAPDKAITNLDGFQSSFKPYNRRQRRQRNNLDNEMAATVFYQFALKTHFLNTYVAYRDAERARGVTEDLDQSTWWDGFGAPFRAENLTDPWVYAPLGAILVAVAVDYAGTQPSPIQPLTSRTNFLFAANYGFWQPVGSGWPEEAFYRGFLRREFKQMAGGSAVVGVLAQSLVFAFSHEPGGGRIGAFAAGAYLGYLVERERGNLAKAAALHFWGNLILGVETILLSNAAQRATPPAGMSVQFNF